MYMGDRMGRDQWEEGSGKGMKRILSGDEDRSILQI
jgi:hypothetical protein